MKFFWCLMHSISRFYWIRVVVYCGVRTGPLAIAAELCAVLPGNAKSPCKRFSFLHVCQMKTWIINVLLSCEPQGRSVQLNC